MDFIGDVLENNEVLDSFLNKFFVVCGEGIIGIGELFGLDLRRVERECGEESVDGGEALVRGRFVVEVAEDFELVEGFEVGCGGVRGGGDFEGVDVAGDGFEGLGSHDSEEFFDGDLEVERVDLRFDVVLVLEVVFGVQREG